MLVAPLSGTGLRKEMAGRVEDAANETIGEVRSAIQRRVAALAIRVGLNLEPGSDLRKEQSRAGRCAILVHRLFKNGDLFVSFAELFRVRRCILSLPSGDKFERIRINRVVARDIRRGRCNRL